MRVIEVTRRVVVFPETLVGHDIANASVGHHVATVEDETNGKRYAYVEQWLVPWKATAGARMVSRGAWEVDTRGNIDFSKESTALSEVEKVIEQAGLKQRI